METTKSGRIHVITPVQEIKGRSGNGFQKRLLVLDARRYDPVTGEPKYDNYPSFEFSGERMGLLDGLRVGDCVTVAYDIEGREYVDPATGEARYFNTLRGYKVAPYRKAGADKAEAATPTATATPATETPAPQEEAGAGYGLPF